MDILTRGGNIFSEEDFHKSVLYYKKAVAIDPGFAMLNLKIVNSVNTMLNYLS